MNHLVIPFEELRMTDVEQVGGKNSSLGEMISQLADSGVRVPGGQMVLHTVNMINKIISQNLPMLMGMQMNFYITPYTNSFARSILLEIK